ncbi:hypothetical protein [Halalkalicoccus tibetensis]|uniref:Uncharacterized protein n=1 Tax=Halalkalicoccus tibetensis TaxID=175632 RepID=A0ABD5V2A8_9EURY
MRRTIMTALAVVFAVGMLASLAGTAAAQGSTDLLLQADEFGPLLELIASLFDISISIEG